MARQKQLYAVMGEMDLFHYFDFRNGELKVREANYLTFLTFPDGSPCLQANLFMLDLYGKSHSRGHARDPGGTIKAYAKDLSHLIRFCHLNCIQFEQMNDSRFTMFINSLRAERNETNPTARKRESNKLNDIGRKSLRFLDFVGHLNGDNGFVENSIKGFKKTFRIKAEKSKRGFVEKTSWHHNSFDTESPTRKRNAISDTNIDQLYQSILKVRSEILDPLEAKFLDRRRNAMLKLLEITGARIGELSLLKFSDFESAMSQDRPMLRLITLKRGDRQERFIPVLKQDLFMLKPYAKVIRPQIVRRNGGLESDHDYFFVGSHGKPLSSKYMSNEVGLLRRQAGITEDACAHMFRNRFITRLFVRLIQEWEFNTPDDFRRALLDTDSFKQQVQQYTNHKSLQSLNVYIDWAFDEFAELDAIIHVVNLRSVYESFDKNVLQLQRELKNGLSTEDYLKRYEELMRLRSEDALNEEATKTLSGD